MPSDNAPKNMIENYWNKYSDDRKRISDYLKGRLLSHPKTVSALKQIAWAIYQPYKWLFIVPFIAFSTTFLTFITFVTALFSTPRAAGRVASFWARLNSFVTPMSVTVKGPEKIDKDQSYIIVANHLSLYDIYVLYGWLGIDFRWVMKKELKKVPVIGFVCRVLQHVYIDRSDSEKAIESINSAKKRIKNGTSIVFFPEGSRSHNGSLKPFKKGAFRLALDLNLPVLPVTIKGTDKILSKGSLNLMPGTAELIVHKPVSPETCGEEALKTLIEKSREAVESGLKA